MEVNNCHTQLTTEFLESLDFEIKGDLLDVMDSILLINRMVSPTRLYAKDKPKDEEGKISIDIANPHILEDMDYFRQPAIHFQKFGNYTQLHPSSIQTSEYVKFWKEEAKRCREGYVRQSDGEWVPGMYYFYLNYSPIVKSKTKAGKKRTDRYVDFPDTYDGDYMYFHYIHQAREDGQHCMVLKRRGCGASYKAAACLARLFVLGDNTISKEMVRAFALANEKEYLIRDGVLNKFVDSIDWLAKHTPWPRIRLKDSLNEMHWKMGFKDRESNVESGTENEVIGVSLMNDPDRARGKRGSYIFWEEVGKAPGILKAWQIARPSVEEGDYAFGTMIGYGCVCAGTKVWNNTGDLINIENITQCGGILGYDGKGIYKEEIKWVKPPEQKNCYKITTSGGDFIECSEDHPLLLTKPKWLKTIKNNRRAGRCVTFTLAKDVKEGDQLLVIDEVPIFGKKHIEDARLIGLLIGDGNYTQGQIPQLACSDDGIYKYMKEKYICKDYASKIQSTGGICTSIGIKGFQVILREAGIYGQVKNEKRLPTNICDYDKNSLSELLGGYFDADGSVLYSKRKKSIRISLTSNVRELLEEVKYQLLKFGVHGKIYTEKRIGGYVSSSKVVYRLYISNSTDVKRFATNIRLLSSKKNSLLQKVFELNTLDRSRIYNGYFKLNPANGKGTFFVGASNMTNLVKEEVTKVECIGFKDVFNLHTSHTNTYISNRFITKQTGGAEGADFRGAEEFFYKPRGYNIYSVPNVYDKGINGTANCGFFFPAYLDRLGCYDKNGNSDVIKALVQVLTHRIEIKYQTSDPNSLVQAKAENPITPQESILRKEGSMFPILDLKDYLAEISPDIPKFTQMHYMGRLKLDTQGNVEWSNEQTHSVIREFPIKEDIDKTGCVELYEMPRRDVDGRVPRGRYISGIDPIDYDSPFGSGSLGSIFVFDLWTDRIVAEYSGRPQRATDFYEVCLRLLKFYNAQANYENNLKGLFAYFDQNRALHYLCDSPQVLRDMEFIKGDSLFGNKAKGTSASKGVNAWGRKLQADWMISDAYVVGEEKEEVDAQGNKLETKRRKNLHTIRSVGYLKEAISWDPDINADRVSAMGMAMILREDRLKYESSRKETRVKSIFEDPWFRRSFSGKSLPKNRKKIHNYLT